MTFLARVEPQNLTAPEGWNLVVRADQTVRDDEGKPFHAHLIRLTKEGEEDVDLIIDTYDSHLGAQTRISVACQ